MPVDVGPVIEAAIDLAWRPTINIAHRGEYRDRIASHERLCRALRSATIPRHVEPPELADLIQAIRRAAGSSYSNRQGLPYYERKEAIHQLRGSLDVYLREPVR
jgi:hypothetical protein